MTDDTIFIIDHNTGRLVLTTLATHLKPGPKLPLWWYAPESDAAMTALCVWLAEQRSLWPQWRSIAERDGPNAVGAAISQQWSTGIECCDSVMVTPGKDPREITVSAILVTHRTVIGRHRFKRVAQAKAFMTWFLSDVSATSFFLLAEGCLIGPDNLSRVMDAITDRELKASRTAKQDRTARRKSPGAEVAIAA